MIHSTRTDGGPWRRTATQYRYHRDNETGPGGDFPYTWSGTNHRLKAILLPEQIEYAAQKAAEIAQPSTPWDALDYAGTLLGLADDDPAWDDPNISDEPLVIDLAAKVIEEYDSTSGEERVLTQYVMSACGCGPGGTQGTKRTYQYFDRDNTNSGIAESVGVTDHQFNGATWDAYRKHYYEFSFPTDAVNKTIPYLAFHAIEDVANPGDYWVTQYDYDSSGNRIRAVTPAAFSAFTPGTATTPPQASYASSGLVHEFSYTADNRLSESFVKDGYNASSATKVEKITYGDPLNQDERAYLPKKIEQFRDETDQSSANEIQTSLFRYGFHSGDAIAWGESSVEAELESENGPNTGSTWYVSHELFDTSGHNTWSRAADDSLTSRTFDPATGLVRTIVENADTTGLPAERPADGSFNGSFAGRNASGGSITTTYVRDLLGRVQQMKERIDGNGDAVSTYFRREMRELPERPDFLYYAEVTLPHEISPDPDEFDGVATVEWLSAGGALLKSKDITVSDYLFWSGSGEYPLVVQNYTEIAETAREVRTHNVAGQLTSIKRWHRLTPTEGVYESTFTYDTIGRLDTTTNENGTITRRTYDVLDRIIKLEVGTDPDPQTGNMNAVAEYFFDSGGAASQGIGNGNLTLARTHEAQAVYRDTIHEFDWRDRPISTINPEAPHELLAYDNLGRVVKRELYTDPNNMTVANRAFQGLTAYSQRGLIVRSSTAIVPDTATPDYIATNFWYDSVGRTVQTWPANSPAEKVQYDGLGRTFASYTTDRSGDAAPGASGNFAHVWNDANEAIVLTGDIVIDQTENEYIADRGLLQLVTHRQRLHNSAATGALQASDAVTTFQGYLYDSADRLIHTVSFGVGTGATNEFNSGGSISPAFDQSIADPRTTYSSALVTSSEYNDRGLIHRVTDPAGTVTRTYFDDLYRSVATVENDQDNITFAWATDRWQVTYPGSGQTHDNNRVTSVVYDGLDNVVKRIAHYPDLAQSNAEEIQVTEYDYGIDVSGVIASNDILSAIHFPDESTGEANQTAAYTVSYTYDNRLGEVATVTDQNGSIHEFERDDLGRVLSDKVTTFGSGIDDSTKALGFEYDLRGLLTKATSYADINLTTKRNEVEYTHTGLMQVESLYQNPSGAVSYDANGDPLGDTRRVWYEHDDSDLAFGGNYSRVAALNYPDGANLDYFYGSSGALNDRISRVESLVIDETIDIIVAEYEFLGAGRVATLTYPTPGALLDRTRYHNGSTTSGQYPGWDRHGRARRQAWIDDDLTTHGTDPDLPNKPPIVELEYQYDAASNRLARIDARPGAMMFNRDYTFDYDELYRVTESKRGVHATGDTALRSQQWELDTLGNWSELRIELTGDGAFTSTDEADTRVHNAANEMTGHSPAFRPNTPYASTYDENGNWLTDKRSTSTTAVYTHDAWDRLVEITIDKATVPPASVTIAKYDYNALNWRIAKESDTTIPIDGLDERREFYYDADWRLLQEEIDNDYIATPGIDEVAQQVWGLPYIDAAAMRRIDAEANGAYDRNYFYLHDANQNVVAILNNTGGLIERMRYDAYGVGRHHWPGDVNGDGAQDANDQNGVQYVGITDPNYNVDADVNRDGAVSLADLSAAQQLAGAATKSALAIGLISDPARADNPIGFAGYVFNAEDTNYTVRHRHYQPIHGRWLERDPAGYVDGMNLFEYARSGPLTFTDSLGLDVYGDALATQRLSNAHIIEMAQSGAIPVSLASSWINRNGANAQFEIDSARWRVQLAKGTAGVKAGVNSTVDTTASFVSLGFWEPAPLLAPTAYERAAGYGGAYFGARATHEIGSLILTSQIPGLFWWDVAGNISAGGRGVHGLATEGFTWGNAAETTAGLAGLGGGVFRAYRGLRCVDEVVEETVEDAAQVIDDASDLTEAFRATPRWRAGRYTTAASQPNAFWDSGMRVFPTRRNSGLRGQALRQAQQDFALRRIGVEGQPVEVVFGQAQEAGLTVNSDLLSNRLWLADPGAQKAIQAAVDQLGMQ